MELQRGRRRLGWVMGGVALVALAALVVAMVRLRGHLRSSALTGQGTGPPVLLITVDTLRADHVGCYGNRAVETPAIDFLAAQGVRFDDALVQVPLTPPSHMVILSGTYPMWNGLRGFNKGTVRKDRQYLAEAFKRHGYATAAFVSAVVLNSSWGLNQGFETYDDELQTSRPQTDPLEQVQRRAGETVDHVLAWFQAHDPRGKRARPFFVWVHLYDPHWPYDPPEPFYTQYASHPYDGEIAYADSQLGRLFDYLRRIGFYDRTLIVLLSDHGESLGEHGEARHGYFIYRSTLRVPLIFKLPRVDAGTGEARVIETPVGTVDVAPTVLELAHIRDPISRQFQGASLASVVLNKTKATERRVYSESYYARDLFGWASLRSITTSQYQYIAAPRPELYEVIPDPSEEYNVNARHGGDAAVLRDQMLDIERRYTDRTASPQTAALSTEAIEKLKSLGYAAYSPPVSGVSDNDLPDPKDKLGIYSAYDEAIELWSSAEYEKSEALLKPLLAKEPRLAIIPVEIGIDAKQLKHWAEAEHYFQAALKIDPRLREAIMGMADVTGDEGKRDESRRWLELEISEQPEDSEAYRGLAELARAGFDLQEARRDFEKAVALDPLNASAQEGLGLLLVDAGRYGEAVKSLEAAVSLASSDPQLFCGLATAYLNTNQPKKAIAAARKGLAIRGDPAGARLNQALAELAAGNRQTAIDEFHSICNDDPADCLQYEKFFH